MPALANYIVIMDTPSTLGIGNAQNFPFGGLALDVSFPTILMFRTKPIVTAGLRITINGTIVFDVPRFGADDGRSLHEVVAAGIVLPNGNTLTATNTGSADLTYSAVALLFKT